MRHLAIVGSGPAGFYTAEALEKAYGEQARIDILDRYPVPYGLIRFGVAPDHQSLKAVSKRYDKVAESAGVDFIGNVGVGSDVSVAELLELYDAVILATGAPHDRKLGIPGENLPGVYEALPYLVSNINHELGLPGGESFVNLQGKDVVVLGGGDTGMDCNRTAIRQGAASVTCTYRRDAENMPGSRRDYKNSVEEGVTFLFNQQPIEIIGNGKVEGVRVVETRLGAPGPRGRRVTENVPGTEQVIPCSSASNCRARLLVVLLA